MRWDTKTSLTTVLYQLWTLHRSTVRPQEPKPKDQKNWNAFEVISDLKKTTLEKPCRMLRPRHNEYVVYVVRRQLTDS